MLYPLRAASYEKMMDSLSVTFDPGPLRGVLSVPGDKSISHRALIAGALTTTGIRVANLNPGADVLATMNALRALGCSIDVTGSQWHVQGGRLRPAGSTIDCANSGSTARMLLGVCAGANLTAEFDGDASLRRRPMEPVCAQLRAFGARIATTDGYLPLRICGRTEVQTRDFILLRPSAQVKSALLFAALFAGVAITIEGDRGSRDHTERLLRALGADITWSPRSVSLGTARLTGDAVCVPGDFSAAAFFLTAACITPGSSILVQATGINPTRTGLIDALLAMGAHIELRNQRSLGGEAVADVAVEFAPLRAAGVDAGVALRAIDELPLVAVAAAFAVGTSTIELLPELRAKESDRVAGVARLLDVLGTEYALQGNRLIVRGGTRRAAGAYVDSAGDHRIAMAGAVIACAVGPLRVDDLSSAAVSFPAFRATLEALQAGAS